MTPLSPGQTANLPLSEVRPNLVALRPAQIEAEDFQDLKNNIKQIGKILQPLRVRPQKDATSGEEYYELIDGLQRYTIAELLGFDTVPVRLAEENTGDVDVLVEQLALNVLTVDTKPVEMSRQLHRIMEHKPAMSKAELAQITGMSEAWVNQRLALNKLVPQIGDEFVDTGHVTATNAYQLARLPAEEQLDFVEQAQTMDAAEFAAAVNQRLTEIRKARAAGRDPAASKGEFVPTPALRKASEIKSANVADILEGTDAKTPEDGAKIVIDWCLQLDPESIDMAKQRHELRKREKAEKQIERQKERAEELSKKAAERAEQLKAELGIG